MSNESLSSLNLGPTTRIGGILTVGLRSLFTVSIENANPTTRIGGILTVGLRSLFTVSITSPNPTVRILGILSVGQTRTHFPVSITSANPNPTLRIGGIPLMNVRGAGGERFVGGGGVRHCGVSNED